MRKLVAQILVPATFAAAGGFAASLPASAQVIIEPYAPHYYIAPDTYGAPRTGDCYIDSLNGRVCASGNH